MPELPEVTVIVDSLNKVLRGLVLESIEYDWPKNFFLNGFSITDLKGAKVKGLRRMGKVVVIDMEKSQRLQRGQKSQRFSIVIHLKLTGQLIYLDKKTRVSGGHPIPPLNSPVPNSTTRVTFAFTNPSTGSGQVVGHLYFNDIRKFGWVKVVKSDEESIKAAIGKTELGPDPLVMSYEQFRDRIRKKPQARIKKLLMDQAFVSGIGNIYSDEALWRAKVHPKRSVVSLADGEIKAIFKGIKDSFELAIAKGGSSVNSFVDGRGEKGLYLTYAKAYHKTGESCERCGTKIIREKMDGRSAHFCPKCQKLE